MRILILEDHYPIREDLVALVEKLGHEAAPVTDAEEAMAVLKELPIDAVITDVLVKRDGTFVPEGGVRLIGLIRHSFSKGLLIARDAPILVISGGREIKGGYSPLRIARDVGADACMQKPLVMEEVAVWIMDAQVQLQSAGQPHPSPGA